MSKDEVIDKSLVGKIVCFTARDGSFTWGWVKDQGFINTVHGEKPVLIVADQLTCRVAKNSMEEASMKRVQNRIEAGKGGPKLLPGTPDQKSLPSYQRFGEHKMIGGHIEENRENCLVPVDKKEIAMVKRGKVPDLSEQFSRTEGLRMNQEVRQVVGRNSGEKTSALMRKFGYDTIVHLDSIDIHHDIIDPEREEFDGMTEEEMFKATMTEKAKRPSSEEVMEQRAIGSTVDRKRWLK